VAIQPIDLQTLYTQLDKIGKTQLEKQQAAQAARDAEQAKNVADAQKKLKSVHETDAGDEKSGVVHERDGDGKGEGPAGKQERKPAADSDEAVTPTEPEVITDPTLGKHIDISG